MKTKINLSMMIVTSVVCLLPLVMSFVVYNDLPDRVGIPIFGHAFDGSYTRFMHKALLAFVSPVLWVTLNIISKIRFNNKLSSDKTPKGLKLFLEWFIPVAALYVVPTQLFNAMSVVIPIRNAGFILAGLILIIHGNYLPKSAPENSLATKRIYVCKDPDILNKTRRMKGYISILGGIIFIIVSLLPLENVNLFFLNLSILVFVFLAPFVYSIILNRKRGKANVQEAGQ